MRLCVPALLACVSMCRCVGVLVCRCVWPDKRLHRDKLEQSVCYYSLSFALSSMQMMANVIVVVVVVTRDHD